MHEKKNQFRLTVQKLPGLPAEDAGELLGEVFGVQIETDTYPIVVALSTTPKNPDNLWLNERTKEFWSKWGTAVKLPVEFEQGEQTEPTIRIDLTEKPLREFRRRVELEREQREALHEQRLTQEKVRAECLANRLFVDGDPRKTVENVVRQVIWQRQEVPAEPEVYLALITRHRFHQGYPGFTFIDWPSLVVDAVRFERARFKPVYVPYVWHQYVEHLKTLVPAERLTDTSGKRRMKVTYEDLSIALNFYDFFIAGKLRNRLTGQFKTGSLVEKFKEHKHETGAGAASRRRC